jgi:hypothetical protein
MEINSGHERPFARLGQAELAVLTINSSHFLTAIIASSLSHGKQGELRQRYREGQDRYS